LTSSPALLLKEKGVALSVRNIDNATFCPLLLKEKG